MNCLCLLKTSCCLASILTFECWFLYSVFLSSNYCNLKAVWCFSQCWVSDCHPEEGSLTEGCLFVLFFRRNSFSQVQLLVSMYTVGCHYSKHSLALLVVLWMFFLCLQNPSSHRFSLLSCHNIPLLSSFSSFLFLVPKPRYALTSLILTDIACQGSHRTHNFGLSLSSLQMNPFSCKFHVFYFTSELNSIVYMCFTLQLSIHLLISRSLPSPCSYKYNCSKHGHKITSVI